MKESGEISFVLIANKFKKGRRVHYVSTGESPKKAPSCLAALATEKQSAKHIQHFE